jgi:hypothetical protein
VARQDRRISHLESRQEQTIGQYEFWQMRIFLTQIASESMMNTSSRRLILSRAGSTSFGDVSVNGRWKK